MIFLRRLLFIGWITTFTSSSLFAQSKTLEGLDVRLEAEVENSIPSIGDWVTYRLMVEGPEGVEFTRAELPEKMPDYVALKARSANQGINKDGRMTRMWEFTFDFFFTGKFPLPSIIVTYKGKDGIEKQLLAPVFFLDIQDLPLDPENKQDILPNRQMHTIQVSYRKYYQIVGLVFGAIVVIGLGIVCFIRWLKKPEKIAPIPAHQIAYEQMQRLVEDGLVEKGNIEEYYVRLSDICRHYLENRFGLRAPEQTTEEFLIIMSETNDLSMHHKELVRDFLRHSDLVKFARYGPSEDEMRSTFESAKRLVDETKESEVRSQRSEVRSQKSAS